MDENMIFPRADGGRSLGDAAYVSNGAFGAMSVCYYGVTQGSYTGATADHIVVRTSGSDLLVSAGGIPSDEKTYVFIAGATTIGDYFHATTYGDTDMPIPAGSDLYLGLYGPAFSDDLPSLNNPFLIFYLAIGTSIATRQKLGLLSTPQPICLTLSAKDSIAYPVLYGAQIFTSDEIPFIQASYTGSTGSSYAMNMLRLTSRMNNLIGGPVPGEDYFLSMRVSDLSNLNIQLRTSTVTAGTEGVTGQAYVDSTSLYVCYQRNAWKKIDLTDIV
jgi:hypothetical protein